MLVVVWKTNLCRQKAWEGISALLQNPLNLLTKHRRKVYWWVAFLQRSQYSLWANEQPGSCLRGSAIYWIWGGDDVASIVTKELSSGGTTATAPAIATRQWRQNSPILVLLRAQLLVAEHLITSTTRSSNRQRRRRHSTQSFLKNDRRMCFLSMIWNRLSSLPLRKFWIVWIPGWS